MNTRKVLLILACAGMLCFTHGANALLFSGSNGTLSASADFEILPGNFLQVTLTNTSTGDPAAPGDILSGLLFNLAGNPLLSRDSAVLGAGSTVIHGPTPSTDPGGGVGGEWAYENSDPNFPSGVNESIYSAGYFAGTGHLFPGSDLQGPPSGSVDGIQYGITTLNDAAGNDNGGIAGEGLIANSVVFTLDNFTGSLGDISNVSFQYGTALTETNIPGTPGVPDSGTTAMLLGSALVGLGMLRRYLKR